MENEAGGREEEEGISGIDDEDEGSMDESDTGDDGVEPQDTEPVTVPYLPPSADKISAIVAPISDSGATIWSSRRVDIHRGMA